MITGLIAILVSLQVIVSVVSVLIAADWLCDDDPDLSAHAVIWQMTVCALFVAAVGVIELLVIVKGAEPL